ncbi:MAG: hypothetical protein JF614_29970 [Acidobacteria bacterium]|nr:hypothetical protein [Acidobacteriota bacterium]
MNGNQVAGIVFGQSGRIGLMTPISQIIAAFPKLGLNLAPAGGEVPKELHAAPAAAMAGVAPLGPAFTSPTSFLGQRLAQVEKEVAATPMGSEVADAVRRHFAETHQLVTSNRRAAAVWRRSGGPQIVQAVLDLVHHRDDRLSEEIDGRPFAECLERIRSALARYASPALARRSHAVFTAPGRLLGSHLRADALCVAGRERGVIPKILNLDVTNQPGA